MRIGDLFKPNYPVQSKTQNAKGTSFGNILARQANSQAVPVSHSSDSVVMNRKLFPRNENSMYVCHTGDYEMNEKSTPENPIMNVIRYDKNGELYKTEIHINDVNPYNATEEEMTALAVYSGKLKSIDDLLKGVLPMNRPIQHENTGLRMNFIQLFKKNADDQRILGNPASSAQYIDNMNFYINWWNSRVK